MGILEVPSGTKSWVHLNELLYLNLARVSAILPSFLALISGWCINVLAWFRREIVYVCTVWSFFLTTDVYIYIYVIYVHCILWIMMNDGGMHLHLFTLWSDLYCFPNGRASRLFGKPSPDSKLVCCQYIQGHLISIRFTQSRLIFRIYRIIQKYLSEKKIITFFSSFCKS